MKIKISIARFVSARCKVINDLTQTRKPCMALRKEGGLHTLLSSAEMEKKMTGHLKKRCKRRLVLLVDALLLAGSLAGCGRQAASGGGAGDGVGSPDRGAWVEKETALTGIPDGVTPKQLCTVEDKVHLVTAADGDGSFILQEWELEGDSFTEVTADWMKDFVIPGESWTNVSLMQDGNGVQYLFYELADEDVSSYRGYLWRGDGAEAKEITPEKWTVVNEEYGVYEFINAIAALDNGSLVVSSWLSADRISGEDGSVLDSVPITGYYDGKMASDGENVYLCSAGMTGDVESVEKWAGGNVQEAETIPLGQSSMSGPKLAALPDGTLIKADNEGIFRCEAGTQDWKKLMSGLDTSFSLSSTWCTDMTALQDGRIYALFQEEGGVRKLLMYEYDPEAMPVVSTVLKLYAVEENTLLQNAAALYHRENPEVLIEVEYVYSREELYDREALDYNTVQQQINTMLMGSESPDILVLDHLNKDSYLEKGLLVELQDVLVPMEESGELLSNIMEAYRTEEGKQYIVPLQFGFTMAMGRDITVQDMASMETLGSFLSGKSENYMGARTVTELVDLFYPYFCGSMVKDKQLDREELSGYLESLKQITDNSGLIEKRDNKRDYNLWELAYKAKFEMEMNAGFNDSMFPLAIADYIKSDFVAFENTFVPYVEMAVSSKSEHQDIAKEFLAFCLSEQVQGKDYYTGFPVNAGCLESQAQIDRTDYAAETTIEIGEGAEEIFQINAYSAEVAQKLVEVCKGLDRPIREDAKIREVLIETLPPYLQGAQSLEETLDKIEGGLKMYLAE